LPLPEIMAAAERGFGAAVGERDANAMVGAILELETAISLWEADTDEDQGTEQARALLRSLIGRLGRAAQDGLADPRDRLRPSVELLIALRNTLRGEGNFAAADVIREAQRQRYAGRHALASGIDGLIRRRFPRPLHLAHVAVRLQPAALGRISLKAH
jgi:uncharacterized protein YcaQ